MPSPADCVPGLPRAPRLPYLFRRPLILGVLAYAGLLTVLRLWRGVPPPPPRDPAWFADGRFVSLRGRVTGLPEAEGRRFRFTLRASSLRRGPEGPWPVDGRVLVRGEDPAFHAEWGDEVELAGILSLPARRTVPGGSDERSRLAERDIYSRLLVPAGRWRVLRSAPAWHPGRAVGRLRARVLASFDAGLSPPAAALMAGVVLGRKPAGFPGLDEDFRRSGTYHLLVASGSNVGFVMALWILVARGALLLPRRVAWAAAVFWAFLYAGLAGGDPPVMRAAVMAAVAVLGHLAARNDRLEHAVFLSMGVLLLARPRALFEAGFQMSYAATLGVIMAAPALEAAESALLRTFPRLRGGRLLVLLWPLRLSFVSLSAQFALFPLLVHYFRSVSWVGLIANMAAVPLSAAGLGLGAALFFSDALLPSGAAPAAVAAALAERTVELLAAAVHLFARAPGALQVLPWTPAQTALSAVLVCAVLITLAGRFWGVRWTLALLLAAVPVLAALGPRPDGRLRILWTDAGAGDAVVALSPGGRVTVVDTGLSAAARFRLLPLLRSRGISRIDRLILTHGDPPHAGGIGPLSEEEVGEFLCSAAAWRDPAWAQERARLRARGVPVRFLKAGDSWREDGATWRVLNPPAEAPADPDGAGLVLEVIHGAGSALLTADLPAARQAEIAAGLSRPPTVVQWPRHGREPLSEGLAGRWTLISGYRSPPRLRSLFLPVTGRNGVLEWESAAGFSRFRRLCPVPPPVWGLPEIHQKNVKK